MPKVNVYAWTPQSRERKLFPLSDPRNEGSSIDLDVMKMSAIKIGSASTLAKQMVEDLAANRIQIPSLNGEEIILTDQSAFIMKVLELAQCAPVEERYSASELMTLAAASDDLLVGFGEVVDWVTEDALEEGDDTDPLGSPDA